MLVGTGYSEEKDANRAVCSALEQAFRDFPEPALIFLFCTDHYQPEEVFQAYQGMIGSSRLVGATVPGLIQGSEVKKRGVAAFALGTPGLNVATCLVKDIGSNSFEQGQKAGRELKKSGIKQGTVFVFPDGFAANISELLRGIYDDMGSDFTYSGGGAGDNLRFYRTYQFNEKDYSSSSVVLALMEEPEFTVAAGHGWLPLGEPMMVTRAKGKTLYELDGIPAFQRYSESLGGVDKGSFKYYGMRYPLGIPGRDGEFLIRDPLYINEDNSIELISEVPENTVTMIMKGDVDSLVATTEELSRDISSTGQTPSFTLVFDCVSRYLLMGDQFDRELTTIKRYLGRNGSNIFGILTFGEVAGVRQPPLFYNKTIVLATR